MIVSYLRHKILRTQRSTIDMYHICSVSSQDTQLPSRQHQIFVKLQITHSTNEVSWHIYLMLLEEFAKTGYIFVVVINVSYWWQNRRGGSGMVYYMEGSSLGPSPQ